MPRKRRAALVVGVIAVCYVIALIAWVARPSVDGNEPAARGPTTGGAPASMSPSGPRASAHPPLSIPGSLDQVFPPSVLKADPSGLPKRSVRIEVTSDAEIARVGYLIAHGEPSSYKAYWVKSPFIAVTTGRSGSVVAFVAAQAGPTASYITCTLIVDGVMTSQRTAHGAYQMTTCLG